MAVSTRPRLTEGYSGNRHTAREKQWYAALADTVGYKYAPKYCDDIINWKQARPPDHILKRWLEDYEDGAYTVDPAILAKVEARVQKFHKQEHVTFLRKLQKAGDKVADAVIKTGHTRQPVLIKYAADGANQGWLLHQQHRPSQELMNLAGLTINVGQRPPPRKLRPRDAEKIIEGEFKELPSGSTA
jgi:hypothetical protein